MFFFCTSITISGVSEAEEEQISMRRFSFVKQSEPSCPTSSFLTVTVFLPTLSKTHLELLLICCCMCAQLSCLHTILLFCNNSHLISINGWLNEQTIVTLPVSSATLFWSGTPSTEFSTYPQLTPKSTSTHLHWHTHSHTHMCVFDK